MNWLYFYYKTKFGLKLNYERSYNSYFKYFYYFFHSSTVLLSLNLLIVEVSRSHSVKPTSLGRTPLGEWSVFPRNLTTHNSHSRQSSILRRYSNLQSEQVSGRRPTPYPLGGAANRIGICIIYRFYAFSFIETQTTQTPTYQHSWTIDREIM